MSISTSKWWGNVKSHPNTMERAVNITQALRVIETEIEKMGGVINGDIHIEESYQDTCETVTLKIYFETFSLAEYISRIPSQQEDRDW
ncbi:MAG: hypothetical protein LBK63_06970 [Treponema sp.]|nr:hypothetical protein [Treponema sp.]